MTSDAFIYDNNNVCNQSLIYLHREYFHFLICYDIQKVTYPLNLFLRNSLILKTVSDIKLMVEWRV